MTRKNKTKQTIKFPNTTFFSISDLLELNPEMKPITLRVKFNQMRESKSVSEIGIIHGGTGRPKKVFCMSPVTKIILEKAKAENITLVDNAEKLITVMTVNSSPVSQTEMNQEKISSVSNSNNTVSEKISA